MKDQVFDLIISNPPYIPSAEIESLQPEVRDHDPRTALDGGPDGLDFYRMLAGSGADFLSSEGLLIVEFGDGQARPVAAIMESHGWAVGEIRDDFTGRPRLGIFARRAIGDC